MCYLRHFRHQESPPGAAPGGNRAARRLALPALRALRISRRPGLPALPDPGTNGHDATMKKRPHPARTVPASGDPTEDDRLQDVWPGWTDETIPALFAHLYLFRLAAHMVLSPAELRAIADKVGPTGPRPADHERSRRRGTRPMNATRTAKKKGQPDGLPLFLMVPAIGVEPTTFALRMRCSTN